MKVYLIIINKFALTGVTEDAVFVRIILWNPYSEQTLLGPIRCYGWIILANKPDFVE